MHPLANVHVFSVLGVQRLLTDFLEKRRFLGACHQHSRVAAKEPPERIDLGAAQLGMYRITSYNVCYTKLLRIVNPRPPGGVSSRNLTSMILADAILNTFSHAAPDRAMAAGGPRNNFV